MDWLTDELLTGFQKLLCLGLDRTPATDLIDGTVMAWQEAICTGREFNKDRDTPRIRAAFVTLASTRDTWPAPKHFLDALPRVEQTAIPYEVKTLSPEEAEARLAECRRLLREPLPEHDAAKAKPTREGPPLAEVESALRQHYGRDGKTAACGPDA
jgi:hypothetical protein